MLMLNSRVVHSTFYYLGQVVSGRPILHNAKCEYRTENAKAMLACLLLVIYSFYLLDSLHYIVFGSFKQIKANQKQT